jgi:hypothetical protein
MGGRLNKCNYVTITDHSHQIGSPFNIAPPVCRDGEPLDWEQVEVERLSVHHYRCGLVSISFPTYHFSFFKVGLVTEAVARWGKLTSFFGR